MGFYVAIFRRAGRGELLFSYPSITELRESLGMCPLRYDESVTVYRFDSIDAAGELVDSSQWKPVSS